MDENPTKPKIQRASRKVLGMPVLSIREGNNLGNIKGFILDAREKGLLAFVVERRRITKEERMLPFSAISSIGEDVVTVERLGALERRGINPAIMNALRRPVQPIGARCFTAGGKTLGKVEEYYIDVQSGKISQLEISNRGLFKGNILIDGDYIIALAPHTIMLRDEALEHYQPVENPLLNSMEAAMDKASEFTRSTANALGNSLNKIIGGNPEAEDDRQPIDIPADGQELPEQTGYEQPTPEQASAETTATAADGETAADTQAAPLELGAPLQLPEHTAGSPASNLVVLEGQPELDLLPRSGEAPEQADSAPLTEDDLTLLPLPEEQARPKSELISVEVLTPEEAAALDGFSTGSSILDLARAAVEEGLEDRLEAEEQAPPQEVPQQQPPPTAAEGVAEPEPDASKGEAEEQAEPETEAKMADPAAPAKKKKKKKRRKKK